MPKNKVSEWSTTAASNTDIGGININEGCPPSGINNAIRELMAQVRDFQLGADGDGLTVSTLNATTATIGALTATSATVTNATVTSLTATNFEVSGTISGLTVTTLRVLGETTGTTATFGNLSASSFGAVTATSLNVSGATVGTTATFGQVITDTISENTPDAGVTIDGLLIKDGALPASALTLTRETAKNTTSGTSVVFTDIPSWVRRITFMVNGVMGGGSGWEVQIGDSGGLETTGYDSWSSTSGGTSSSTTGFNVRGSNDNNEKSGVFVINNFSGNTWVASHDVQSSSGAGIKTLSGTLDRVAIVADGYSFSSGSVNIIYE